MTDIRILHTDAELERLIPPLARAERELLEASLKKEGCRDPLIVWAGHDIILDGHNRWAICNRHISPSAQSMWNFPTGKRPATG